MLHLLFALLMLAVQLNRASISNKARITRGANQAMLWTQNIIIRIDTLSLGPHDPVDRCETNPRLEPTLL